MSVLIKHMAMPKGCIYANDKDQTEYCPLLNHDDVLFCQYIENEPEIAIGIDERPVYCPLSDVPEPCQDTIYRQDAIDAFGLSEKTRKYDGDHSGYDTRMLYEIQDVLEGLPSAQPTLHGYNIEHLELIAIVLQKEDLPPERVVEAITDIGRIVAIVRDEFEETLRRALHNMERETDDLQ